MFYLTWVRERDLRKEREVLALKKSKTVLNFQFLTSAGQQQQLDPFLICQSNEESITDIFKPRYIMFPFYLTSEGKCLENIHKIMDSCCSKNYNQWDT